MYFLFPLIQPCIVINKILFAPELVQLILEGVRSTSRADRFWQTVPSFYYPCTKIFPLNQWHLVTLNYTPCSTILMFFKAESNIGVIFAC